MFSTRTVTIAVAITVVFTLYSLSELHHLSVQHAVEDQTQSITLVTPTTSSSTTRVQRQTASVVTQSA